MILHINFPRSIDFLSPNLEAYTKQIILQFHYKCVDAYLLEKYSEELWESLKLIQGLDIAALLQSDALEINSDQAYIQNLLWEMLNFSTKNIHNKLIYRKIAYSKNSFVPLNSQRIYQVLFFTSQVKHRLAFEQEQSILQKLFSPYRTQLKFIVSYDGSFQNFQKLILQDAWDLVIFGGHAGFSSRAEPVLFFENDSSTYTTVNSQQLFQLFKDTQVHCLILAACYSAHHPHAQQSLSQILAAIIPHVIGIQGAILDQAILKFTTEFCNMILQGKSIGHSVQDAQRMMHNLLQPNEIWCDQYHKPQYINEVGQSQLPVLYSVNPDQCLFNLDQSVIVDQLSCPIVIGRRKERHTLHQLIRQHSSILVTGKSGCGKTIVIQQIAYDLQLEGRTVTYITTLQQIQHLNHMEDNTVYIIDSMGYEISNILSRKLSQHIYKKNVTIIIASAEENPISHCHHYILPPLHIEDFKAYGQQLGIVYSSVQYQLLYQTVAGDIRVLPLLKNNVVPKTREALLQQLKVINRYLQAIKNY